MGKNTGIARTRSPRVRTPKSVAAPIAGEIVTVVLTDDSDRVVAIEQGTPVSTAPALVSVPRADEFVVDGAAFRRALAIMTSVVDKRSTMPMLANVRLLSGLDGIDITGTDLDVYLTIRLATGKGSARGGTTIAAHALSALVKTLPAGEIGIAPNGTHAAIASGPVNARIASLPDRDYPKIPTFAGEWTTVDATALRDAVDATLFSVCKDETRFHLNGALIQSDGTTLTVVTTDGHRLTKAHAPWSWSGPSLAKGIIVRSTGLTQLRKVLAKVESCEVGVAAPFLFVRAGNATLAVKLTDADFPPYEQVIPKGNTRLLTVDRKAFIAALNRCKVLCCETRGVRLEMASGSLTIAADHPDLGDAREVIAADYQGTDFRWGVNPKYLLDLLQQIDDASVTLGFDPDAKQGELNPCHVRATDDAGMRPLGGARLLGVIMPMHI